MNTHPSTVRAGLMNIAAVLSLSIITGCASSPYVGTGSSTEPKNPSTASILLKGVLQGLGASAASQPARASVRQSGGSGVDCGMGRPSTGPAGCR